MVDNIRILYFICLWLQSLQVYPPSSILVSRGQARSLLARLRALQEATGMDLFPSSTTQEYFVRKLIQTN